MSSENLHAPRDRLSRDTISLHHAIISVQEELDAVDWYRQRADDSEDPELRGILLHNMREEMEHASMLLEWIRRNNADFDSYLRTYLFTDAPILQVEEVAESKAQDKPGPATASTADGESGSGPIGHDFTIGSMKEGR
jgi:hypothetical protein